jgi:hypothetical protein
VRFRLDGVQFLTSVGPFSLRGKRARPAQMVLGRLSQSVELCRERDG